MNYVILQILFVGVIGERATAVYDYFGKPKEITAVLFACDSAMESSWPGEMTNYVDLYLIIMQNIWKSH